MLTGRSRMGMSYFGIRNRYDFIKFFDSLCTSFRPFLPDTAAGDIGNLKNCLVVVHRRVAVPRMTSEVGV